MQKKADEEKSFNGKSYLYGGEEQSIREALLGSDIETLVHGSRAVEVGGIRGKNIIIRYFFHAEVAFPKRKPSTAKGSRKRR